MAQKTTISKTLNGTSEADILTFDHDEGTVRDTAGKRIGDIIDDRTREFRMSAVAAAMNGSASGEEQLVRMDLGKPDVSIGGTKATFASTFNDFIADFVAPPVVIASDRGSWFGESTDDTIKQLLPIGDAPGATVPEINPALSATSFTCATYALSSILPEQVRQNADFDIVAVAVMRIAAQLKLQRELRVMSLLTSAANWASNNVVTTAAGAKWNGGASKSPLFDVAARMGTSALAVNAIILPEQLEPFFATDASVVNFVMAGRQFPTIRVARAKTTTAGVPAYVWLNDVVLVREPESELALSTARTLRWNGVGPNDRAVDGFFAREFFLHGTGSRGSRGVCLSHADAEVFIGTNIGGVIKAAFQ